MKRSGAISVAALVLIVTMAPSQAVAFDLTLNVCSDSQCSINCSAVTIRGVNQEGCDNHLRGVLGTTYYSITRFDKSDCNDFSNRRASFGATGNCEPWGPDQFAVVPPLTQHQEGQEVQMTVKFVGRPETTLDLIEGSCNDIAAPNNRHFSIVPLCLRGRVVINYYAGTRYCTGVPRSLLHESNMQVQPLLRNDIDYLRYSCLSDSEAACLSLRGSPYFIISVSILPVILALLVAITFMRALFVAYCGESRLPQPGHLQEPFAENEKSGTKKLGQLIVDGVTRVVSIVKAVLRPQEERTETQTVIELPQPFVVGEDYQDEHDAVLAYHGDFKGHPSISQYSADTARGFLSLAAFCYTASVSLLFQAALRETLANNRCRQPWQFAFHIIGYASLMITGSVASDNITAQRRRFSPCCCLTFSTEKRKVCGSEDACFSWASFFHVGSFAVFMFLPSLAILISWNCTSLAARVLTIIAVSFTVLHGIVSACVHHPTFSFFFEIIAVGSAIAAFTLAESYPLWECAIA